MTGRLQTTMQRRADTLDTWDVDLDAIVRAGDRRVRRRRSLLAGGVAAVLALTVGALTVVSRAGAPEPAGSGADGLAYAVGSVIHAGSDTIDVGVDVWALVRSDDGFVFTTPDLQVMAEQDGHVHRIGRVATANTRLVAADDGHYVGWWDGERFQLWPGTGGHTDSVDVGSRAGDAPPDVLAISGEHVWLWNGARVFVADKPESDAVYSRYAGAEARTVADAAAGRLLVFAGGGMAVIDEPTQDEPSNLSQMRPQVADVTTGDLAPDGKHWFTTDTRERDVFEVFDSVTGHAETPAYDGGFVTPYAWLGNDSIAAWTIPDGGDGTSPVTLLTCRVSSNTCSVAARDIGRFGRIALDGQPVS